VNNELIIKTESHLGIELKDFEFDGKFHRYGKKKEFWVIGKEITHQDRQISFINCGNFVEGSSHRINNVGEGHSRALANKILSIQNQMNEKVKEEKEKALKACIEKWLPVWNTSKTATHTYLEQKSIHPFNSRVSPSGELLIPLYDTDKSFSGLQRISFFNGKSQKFFATGTKTKGSFCFLNKECSREKIYICEGFATAASVQEAVPECSVVCAFNSGNLKSVVKNIKDLFPFSKIIIAADLDKSGIGEKKAKEAVENMPGAIYILPKFINPSSGTDFNDLHTSEDINQVRQQLVLDEATFRSKDFEMDIIKGFIKTVGDNIYKDHNRLREYFDFMYHYKVVSDDGRIFVFDGRMYSAIGELKIKEFAQFHYSASGEYVSAKEVAEFYSLVQRTNQVEEFDGSIIRDGSFINFFNGVLEVATGQLLPHDSKYFFTYVIPHFYNHIITCPTWDLMLKNLTLDRKDLTLNIEEFLGFALSNIDYSFLPKALILDGGGANGKTTLVNAFKMVLGNKNVSSILISSINENRFMSSNLFKSLLNISEEEKVSVFRETDNFKRLTGGSPLTAEKKGKDAFQFTNRAKLVMTYNKMPAISDRSNGMFRRLLTIPCDQNFTDHPELFIPDLESKLLNEVSGIINRAIDGLKRLKERSNFSESVTIKKRVEETFMESDVMASWLEERIVITENTADKEITDVLYTDFVSHVCPVPQPSKFKFGKDLKSLVHHLSKKHPKLAYGQIKVEKFAGKGVTGIKMIRD